MRDATPPREMGHRYSIAQADAIEMFRDPGGPPQFMTLPRVMITDAPYLLTKSGTESKLHGGRWGPENYDNGGLPVKMKYKWKEWLPVVASVLADDCEVMLFTNDKNLRGCLDALHKERFKLHNIITWDKGRPLPNRWFMKQTEFIVYAWRGKARIINDCSTPNIVRFIEAKITSHPTEKPVAIMEYLIRNITDHEDTILDPFMGSGSTGVAAINLGRYFVGIDIEQEWFETAAARLGAAEQQRQKQPPLLEP